MKNKVLCTALGAMMLMTTTASATGKPWWLSKYRVTFDNDLGIVGNVTLTFASDGGSFIRPITKRYGESVRLESYVPTKYGYTFKGWFTDPRTKQNQVTTFKFTKPDVLYAKWEKNLIAKNPTEGTTVPKKKKKDLKVLNDSELDKLMQALNDDKEWGDFFYLELTTGLRRGEICGLKWENFDEEQNKLYIRTNIYRDNGELKEGKPKTDEGERCIILPKATADMLKQRRRISKWIFPNLTTPELPIAPEAAYRKAKLILKKLNLPNISFHDLRHTFATHAIASGVDAKT